MGDYCTVTTACGSVLMTRLLLHQRALCEGEKCSPRPMPHAQHVLRRTHTLMFMLRHHLTIMLCRYWVDSELAANTSVHLSEYILAEWTKRSFPQHQQYLPTSWMLGSLFVPDSKLGVQTGNSYITYITLHYIVLCITYTIQHHRMVIHSKGLSSELNLESSEFTERSAGCFASGLSASMDHLYLLSYAFSPFQHFSGFIAAPFFLLPTIK